MIESDTSKGLDKFTFPKSGSSALIALHIDPPEDVSTTDRTVDGYVGGWGLGPHLDSRRVVSLGRTGYCWYFYDCGGAVRLAPFLPNSYPSIGISPPLPA